MIKVTERIPNFVDIDRKPYIATVSKIPEIPKIDWIKERSKGESIILDKGAIKLQNGWCIGLYEWIEQDNDKRD